MNWTIGVSDTHDRTVAFARNERESYGLKDPLNDLPSYQSSTTVKTRIRKAGDTHRLSTRRSCFLPNASAVPEGDDCLRIERAF